MTKVTRRNLRAEVRENYLATLVEFFTSNGEDVLRTKSNQICIPVVDREGNEDFLTITLAIPTGERGTTEGFDGYSLAEEYKIKCENKALKKKKG